MLPDGLALNLVGWKLALASLLLLLLVIAVFHKLDPKKPIIDDLNAGEKKNYFSTDTTFGYAPRRLFKMLGEHYRPCHFDAHRRFIKYDLAFALLYSVTAAVIIMYFQNTLARWPGDPSGVRHLWLAPLAAGAFDILEGLSMWGVLAAYKKEVPASPPLVALALFSTTMTMSKLLFIVVTVVLLFAGLAGLAGLVIKKVWQLNT